MSARLHGFALALTLALCGTIAALPPASARQDEAPPGGLVINLQGQWHCTLTAGRRFHQEVSVLVNSQSGGDARGRLTGYGFDSTLFTCRLQPNGRYSADCQQDSNYYDAQWLILKNGHVSDDSATITGKFTLREWRRDLRYGGGDWVPARSGEFTLTRE